MQDRSIVLDANILIRAVLGERVRSVLAKHCEDVVEARRRLNRRDPEDWPILALALALECPIWTEDSDFFGCGAATWTTSNIALFLER